MEEIKSNKAPKAVGPYSQAIKIDKWLFCSGQISPGGGIEQETKQTLENLLEVLKAAGLSFKNVVRVDIFLKNINDFPKVNEIYSQYFTSDPKPARQTVAVKNLPKKALIEISCIAFTKV